jgi:L-threonylcarbamoyladenylate synthase
MKLLGIDNPAALEAAASALKSDGAVLLLPTETVYGLVCRASDAKAVQRIYELKGRVSSKPLGWFVDKWQKMRDYGAVFDSRSEEIARRFTPGALTLIVRKSDGGTIGFRVPDHKFLLSLVALTGEPLAQTSANLSGEKDARSCQEAIDMLCGEVDLAIDGGVLDACACASTVADVSGDTLRILREGAVDLSEYSPEK